MYKIMIYLDDENVKSCLELLEVAEKLGKNKGNYEIYGVGFNLDYERYNGYLDYLINIKTNLCNYDIFNRTRVLFNIVSLYNFKVVLLIADDIGRMIGPRLAIALKTGIVADVVSIEFENGKPIMIRPAFSGKIMAGIKCDDNKTLMCTIRAGIFKFEQSRNKQTNLITEEIWTENELEILNITEDVISYDIRDAEFIIGFGNGIKKDLNYIYELADKMGAQVAVSKKIVERGDAKRKMQIGQSGKIVSPKVYIALGISGAIEHVQGLKDVDTIISVNINHNAPICFLSDIVIEGDANLFVKKLLEKL
ncbi:hypothetical protein AN639_03840 [Candidatus Epulonipiscium fishelsonii]|uniref:Uncharacterized protein n=1 Tax=Candidatus Epulonipiscium fishelsonii TaxID=77094 RepID=A0ACC8XAY8_9FIRM|nr:hypothetical protein AN396_08540 [Epulopiscium sp. SCG-B11WGA-EpuloA1]ONI41192.1 hypothetical protein AN639_03840 [Epulopiscium sp. SCG-B05WGA-EpuloA1]